MRGRLRFWFSDWSGIAMGDCHVPEVELAEGRGSLLGRRKE